MTPLTAYTTDHRYLVEEASKAAGITDPVAFQADYTRAFYLMRISKRGPVVPLDGVLLRTWQFQSGTPKVTFGIRLYSAGDASRPIQFALCAADVNKEYEGAYSFYVVDRKDYLRLYSLMLRSSRTRSGGSEPPVMYPEQLDVLRQNTIGYLDRDNLERIRSLGGRARRGLLLTGPPGNGKTSVCRWLLDECLRLGFEHQQVSPDAYQAARKSCNPVHAVRELFVVHRRGIIFFDDMDIALRDRNTVKETDDQAVFLSAMDGIEVHEGVVYVFTTNCPVSLIDPAFKRPGRIDLVMQFQPPDIHLRRRLLSRWHQDIQKGIDIETAVEATEGFSFAELEEVKNQLILRYLDTDDWDWDGALRQFHENRQELASVQRQVGFAPLEPSTNGHE
jgi:hypothetical protein